MIKAIIFDFAGVIVSDEFIIWVKNLDKNFEKNEQFYHEVIRKGDLGEISVGQFKETIAAKLQIDPSSMWPTLMDKFKLKKDTVNIIKKLKKNYRIGLLSNFVPGWIDDLLKNYNLLPLFDEIVVSSKYHVLKPQNEAYEKILQLLKITPNDALFIDDRIKNVEAAQKLGIKSLLFQNSQKLLDDLKKAGIRLQ